MNFLRKLGLDILAEKYAYAHDPEHGHTSAQKVPDRWVATTCGYCSVGCGLFLGVKDGRAVSVRGNPHHPVNLGKLCPKGLSEHYTLEAPNRVMTPLLRKSGKLVSVSWEEALGTLVTKFRNTQARYGRDALGVISTGQLVTEEFYTLGKLVQLGFATKNYDGNTTLCMASAVSGYKRSFGSDGPPGAYEDLEKADLIFLIGANIADNHPILCQHLEGNPRKTLIVADPRVTKTAMMADLFLPLKPRSDIALINGIIHVLIQTGQIDCEFIAQHQPISLGVFLCPAERFVFETHEPCTPHPPWLLRGRSHAVAPRRSHLIHRPTRAPDSILLDDPVDHPPGEAEIVPSIDGCERRWTVRLPDWVAAGKPETRIAFPL